MPGLDEEKELEGALSTNGGPESDVLPRSEPVAEEPHHDAPTEKELEANANIEGLGKVMTRSTIDSTEDGISKANTNAEKPKKKWYKRLNPLKRRPKPPVPQERTVSREYTAGFFSLVTFQWMAPLMTVCRHLFLQLHHFVEIVPTNLLHHLSILMFSRPATSDLYN